MLTGFEEGGILLGTVFRLWGKSFVNLIYPLSCLICKISLSPLSDKPLCKRCWNEIEFNRPPFCRVCGRHLPAKNQNQTLLCKDCQKASYFFSSTRAVCIYEGIIKECIHLFKYNSKLSLVKPLAKLMIDSAHNCFQMNEVELIVPVPLHIGKLRQRQFNQAQLLAKPFAKEFAKELKDRLLIKIKSGAAQVNLSRRERLKNIQGSFKVRTASAIKDKHILLIDDVVTTGATANECAKILLEAGAKRVDVFALARSK